MKPLLLFFICAVIFVPFCTPACASDTIAAQQQPLEKGYGYIAAALSAGIAALGAGIAVGITGSAAIGAISERPELFGKVLVFVGLAEGIAIYGLIISIMILGRI